MCAFALHPLLDYDSLCLMTTQSLLRCDGCGQPASPEHIAKRLQRLEWTTRYRPLHIDTLLLGAVAPRNDADFLYAEGGAFTGEAGIILEVTGLSTSGKPPESTLAEFQRGGFLLTYVLDCAVEEGAKNRTTVHSMLAERLPAVLARIRRSLRPKRLVPISQMLEPVLQGLAQADLGCSILLDAGQPFALDEDSPDPAIARLRHALAAHGC